MQFGGRGLGFVSTAASTARRRKFRLQAPPDLCFGKDDLAIGGDNDPATFFHPQKLGPDFKILHALFDTLRFKKLFIDCDQAPWMGPIKGKITGKLSPIGTHFRWSALSGEKAK
jgi:hypothetical protein